MKFAVPYNSSFRYFNEIDEVIFDYTGQGNLIEFIPKTLKEQEQRAIIRLINFQKDIEEVIPFLNKLKEVHNNFVMSIDFYTQKDFIKVFKENDIKYMFYNYAVDLSTVCAMSLSGVEDIYIAEDLCFNLKNLQEIRKNGIKFRIIPDVGQVAKGCKDLPQITKFFVRPEDISLYEHYVDVMEFFHNDDKSSVVYEIYRQQAWQGKLNQVILDLNTEVMNQSISPAFAEQRINCNKRCTYRKCNICKDIEQMGILLSDAEMAFVYPKVRKDFPQEKKDRILKELEDKKNESKSD